jgi:hypothetical protein
MKWVSDEQAAAIQESTKALKGILDCPGLGRLPGHESEIDAAVARGHAALKALREAEPQPED